jgi:hypothetical protein
MKLLTVQVFPTSRHLISRWSKAPCSQTTLVYVPPLMSESKLQAHTEPQTKL